MEELIFFSIPGGIFVLTMLALFKELRYIDAAFFIVLVPVVGYVIHQLYRLCFELTDGYGRKSRLALQRIAEICLKANISLPDDESAFMIWVQLVFGDKVPPLFGKHDSSVWHFILSFWSTSFSAIISLLLVLAFWVFGPIKNFDPSWSLWATMGANICFTVLFLLMGNTLYMSINHQEIAFVNLHQNVVLEVAAGLYPPQIEVTQSENERIMND